MTGYFIEMPNPKLPIAVGTRVHFLRNGEISEGSSLVTALDGTRVIVDQLPHGVREGDELISFKSVAQ